MNSNVGGLSVNHNTNPALTQNRKKVSPQMMAHRGALAALKHNAKPAASMSRPGNSRSLFAKVAKSSQRMAMSGRFSAAFARLDAKTLGGLKTADREKSKEALLDLLKEGDETLSDADACLVLKTFKGGQLGQGGLKYDQLDAEMQETIEELTKDLYAENAEEVDAKDIRSFIESTDSEEEKKKRRAYWWCDDEEELSDQEIMFLLNLISIEEFMQLAKKQLLQLGSVNVYQRVVSYKSFKKDDAGLIERVDSQAQEEANQALAHKTMELAGVSWLTCKIKRMYTSNSFLKNYQEEIKKELGEQTAFFIHDIASKTMTLNDIRDGIKKSYRDAEEEKKTSSFAQKKQDDRKMAAITRLIRAAIVEYIEESPNKTRNIQRLDALLQQTNDTETESLIWKLV